MRELCLEVERAAALPGGVLLAGESGTGRGRVARTIHAMAHQQGAPFVALYCNKANHSTLEAELFGTAAPHRANPMPGSGLRLRSGPERIAQGSLLHRARGGTLFLAHAEMIPDRVQARLVQILDDGRAIIGANIDPEPVSVRPMTALEPRILSDRDDDRIRPDLFKRLAAVTVTVPPLRERREDIPELAERFVARACRQRGLPEKTLAPEVLAVLGALPWKGNAREMNELIDSLVLTSDGGDVGMDALMAYLRLEYPNAAAGTVPDQAKAGTLRQARMQFEREYISAVLARHRGRIPDAARALGIQRTNLYRKLRLLQLGKTRSTVSAE
jgi:DNA-binding NtrC family response regulator